MDLAGMPVVAIDWDDTYTLDPEFWTGVVKMMLAKKWVVVCITGRRKSLESTQEIRQWLPHEVELHYSYDQLKYAYSVEHGIDVDVWIDNDPMIICG